MCRCFSCCCWWCCCSLLLIVVVGGGGVVIVVVSKQLIIANYKQFILCGCQTESQKRKRKKCIRFCHKSKMNLNYILCLHFSGIHLFLEKNGFCLFGETCLIKKSKNYFITLQIWFDSLFQKNVTQKNLAKV